jgi:antitoxin (DNA-binding transcriptional repressor) of toxin-antitoxin stability system
MQRAECGEELLVTFRGRPRFRVVPAELQLPTAPVAGKAHGWPAAGTPGASCD